MKLGCKVQTHSMQPSTVVKTLVTGGTGFIGSHVTQTLLNRGRQVILFDRCHEPGPRPDGVERYLGDVTNPVDVCEAMAHAQSWIHLAGVLGTTETVYNPRPATVTNISGGLNVLEAAAQYQLPGVNIAVGNHRENNPYSISKSTVERFCGMYRRDRSVPVTVVRAFNAYGPGQVPAAPYGPSKVRKLMPSLICRALAGEPLEVYGDGQQIMDMVHVRDVAEILVAALEETEARGGLETVVEAGTGRATTVTEIAELVLNETGGGEIRYLPMRPGETPGAVVLADTSTLAAVGVDPAGLTRLEDGVAETVAWYRERVAA